MRFQFAIGVLLFGMMPSAFAAVPVRVVENPSQVLVAAHSAPALSAIAVQNLVSEQIDLDPYREARAHVVYANERPDHIVVFLKSKEYHYHETAAIRLDSQMRAAGVQTYYQLTAADRGQLVPATQPTCPDPTVQFIAFCPNDIDLEIEVTQDVAQAAEAHGLKTVLLLKEQATTEAYLNYMSCPNLVGNFYDGDSNPEEFITFDGLVHATDFSTRLAGVFRGKVTNIWLACQAYNDPMFSSVTESAQAQKYAAGINNLLVGPSDYTAACAMKAAMDGKPMEAAFWDCYKQLDDPADQWGFGGHGADLFAQ